MQSDLREKNFLDDTEFLLRKLIPNKLIWRDMKLNQQLLSANDYCYQQIRKSCFNNNSNTAKYIKEIIKAICMNQGK